MTRAPVNGLVVQRILWIAASTLGMAATVIGVLAWGLKLESRIEGLQMRTSSVEAQIAVGVLPRAEEKISAMQQQHRDLMQRIYVLEQEAKHQTEGSR